MDWKYGDVLIDTYGNLVIFLGYTYDYAEPTFKGRDKDGCLYDDYLVRKFKKEA